MNVLFSEWLNSELNKRGMSQADLARITGLTRGGISNLVNQVREPDPKTLTAIAEAWGLDEVSVFRIAGLLPAKPAADEKIDEALHILSMLETDDLEEIIQIARLKLEREKAGTKKSRSIRPARSLLKDK